MQLPSRWPSSYPVPFSSATHSKDPIFLRTSIWPSLCFPSPKPRGQVRPIKPVPRSSRRPFLRLGQPLGASGNMLGQGARGEAAATAGPDSWGAQVGEVALSCNPAGSTWPRGMGLRQREGAAAIQSPQGGWGKPPFKLPGASGGGDACPWCCRSAN